MPQSSARKQPLSSSPIPSVDSKTRLTSCIYLDLFINRLQNDSSSHSYNKEILEKAEALRVFMKTKYSSGLSWVTQQELFKKHIQPLYTVILTNTQAQSELDLSLEKMTDSCELNEVTLTKELLELKNKCENLYLINNQLKDKIAEMEDENCTLNHKIKVLEAQTTDLQNNIISNQTELEDGFSSKCKDLLNEIDNKTRENSKILEDIASRIGGFTEVSTEFANNCVKISKWVEDPQVQFPSDNTSTPPEWIKPLYEKLNKINKELPNSSNLDTNLNESATQPQQSPINLGTSIIIYITDKYIFENETKYVKEKLVEYSRLHGFIPKINDFIKLKSGIKINCPSQLAANNILKFLEEDPIFGKRKITCVSKLKPRIIIKFTTISDSEELIRQLKLNDKIFTADNAKILFKIDVKPKRGPKKNLKYHWVLEVPPNMFNYINNLKIVYLNADKCQIEKFVPVKFCRHCLSYGHTLKHCRSELSLCHNCGENAHEGPCVPRCVQCTNSNRKFNTSRPTDHVSGYYNCEFFGYIKKRIEERTNYG